MESMKFMVVGTHYQTNWSFLPSLAGGNMGAWDVIREEIGFSHPNITHFGEEAYQIIACFASLNKTH